MVEKVVVEHKLDHHADHSDPNISIGEKLVMTTLHIQMEKKENQTADRIRNSIR
jgi:hypothetical protein